MTINIEWTRDDLKKLLQRKRKKTNIIIFVISFLIYLYIMYSGLKYDAFDNFVILLSFVIYLFVIYMFLLLTTKLYVKNRLKRNDKRTNMAYGKYVIKLDDEKIMSIFNEQRISYKWKEITKFKKKKDYFFLRTANDLIGLTFRRSELKDDYDKMLEYVLKRIPKKTD